MDRQSLDDRFQAPIFFSTIAIVSLNIQTEGLWRPDWDRISTHLDLGFGGCGNSPRGSTLRLRSSSFGGSDTETVGAGNIALGLYKEHDLRFKALVSDSATVFIAWPTYIINT